MKLTTLPACSVTVPAALLALAALCPPAAAQPALGGKVRVVALGDSITRGVRPGVAADQTFAALLQADLRKQKADADVINVGVGGERTDQALKRLEKAVLALKPAVVLVTYGTNDSYVDQGKQ